MRHHLTTRERIKAIAAFDFFGASFTFAILTLTGPDLRPALVVTLVLTAAAFGGAMGRRLATSTWAPFPSRDVQQICEHLTPEEHAVLVEREQQHGRTLGRRAGILIVISAVLLFTTAPLHDRSPVAHLAHPLGDPVEPPDDPPQSQLAVGVPLLDPLGP